jgi:Secretion system C-terminal sorting domain
MGMRAHGTRCCIALTMLAEVATAQDIVYPLEIGTKWQWSQYWSTSSYGVEISKDTLAPNGHRYAIIPGYWSMPERWERQESTRVYRYLPYSQQEWLLFDFSKSPGDTINHSPIVVLYAAGMDTLFGINRRTWVFGVGMVPGIPDAGAGYTITDTLGLTDYGDYNSALRVVGAVIGFRIYGTVTGVSENAGVFPGQFTLCQNYPNPCNPSTTIRYGLPRRSQVTLTVFNTLGQQVTTLVQGEQEKGYHEVRFDASNLSSGVYFYRIRAGEFVQTRKLLLLR